MTRRHLKWILLALATGALVLAWSRLPLEDWVRAFIDWAAAVGPLGWIAFGLLYVVATVALVPGAVLTLAAGLAFGLWAFPLVVLSAALGAWLAFLLGRHLARRAVAHRFEGSPRFQAVDRAVRAEGWKIVALMRLSPLVPFNLQNYLFGLTDVRFWHYAWATFFGIMPGTLLFVYLGAAGRAAVEGGVDGESGALRWVFFALGLAATLLVTVIVTRAARRQLHRLAVDAPDA